MEAERIYYRKTSVRFPHTCIIKEMGLKLNSLGAIELIGMEFHAHHGCLKEEKTEGNTFIVDFLGHTGIRKAAKSDSLEDTIDYSRIYGIIAREMEKPSDLLEAVAGRIVDSLAREAGDLVFIQVRVAKKNPPVGGKCAWSRVTASYGEDLAPDELKNY